MSPRLLAVMGSGETAPTMARVHRDLLARVGPDRTAVLLDTPYGFQENADEISARTVEYFRRNLDADLAVARWRTGDDDPVDVERALTRLAEAGYVFAGPGSPTYALGRWRGTPLPDLLAETLAPGGRGGCVTFASAAALTLGVVTVPVYEVYKAGAPPAWHEGLGVVERATGLRAAVVPHYDNAEGGTHDTRFCYLGERRLSAMERALPEGAFVLGVDEHTAAVLDLDAGVVEVLGRGGVTVRVAGRSTVHPAGSVVPLDGLASGGAVPVAAPPARQPDPAAQEVTSLRAGVAALEERFAAALAARDVDGAVRATLDVEALLVAWSADTTQSEDVDRARTALRGMVSRLGEAAVEGLRDPRAVVGPFVDAVVAARAAARAAGSYDLADALRDRLAAAGVDLRDTPAGTEWNLQRPAGRS